MFPTGSPNIVTLHVGPQNMYNRIVTTLLSLPPVIEFGGQSHPPFTLEEAEQLAGITTFSNDYLFDPTNSDNFYQLVTTVLQMKDGKASIIQEAGGSEIKNEKHEIGLGFGKVMKYLNSKKWIFPEETVHESSLLNSTRDIIERIILIEEQEPVVEEGNIVCVRPGCSSRRIFRREQTTRGADESTTVFLLCTECGKNWKKN
uniref:Transcription factor S-II n=1 Tax=Pithovirus LCPAC201 TaxID=2506591 RepID=A0A481Z574_9VIRU|nr:MAG: transcription factor S-II [Pithovirus LCPAC201]